MVLGRSISPLVDLRFFCWLERLMSSCTLFYWSAILTPELERRYRPGADLSNNLSCHKDTDNNRSDTEPAHSLRSDQQSDTPYFVISPVKTEELSAGTDTLLSSATQLPKQHRLSKAATLYPFPPPPQQEQY